MLEKDRAPEPHHNLHTSPSAWNPTVASALFSDFGSVVATTLHTAGAIAYLAGLVAYTSWTRHLRQGQHQPTTLALGQVLAYIGILANLMGGFIRTYQPGHPTVWDFGSSGWATVMVLKHVALFVGIGLAVYLFEVVAPRLRRIFKDQGSQALPDHAGRVAVWGVATSIFLAAILGAWTTVLPVGAMEPDGTTDMDGGPEAQPFMGGTFAFAGSAQTGGPTAGTFEVGAGATELVAIFMGIIETPLTNLPTSPFVFTLSLVAPDGTVYSEQTDPTSQGDVAGVPVPERRIEMEIDAPEPGSWSFQVSGDAAANGRWELSISVAGPDGFVLADTVHKAAGAGFCEINTEMEEGAVLSWNWSTEPATPIHFDVHTHFDGEVQYLVDDDAVASHAGNVTATRTGGYSLLWENTSNVDVAITYRVTGDYRIHSIVGC